jgi:hypothetical protein
MIGIRLLVALSATVLTIGVASPAHAQVGGKQPRKVKVVAAPPATPADAAAPAQEKSGGSERKAAPRKVVKLEEMRVEGRVQKPQALFLMPRASVNAEEQPDRSESFLSKAKDAVAKDPF